MAVVPAPSFEFPAVKVLLKQAFPPPTYKIHVLSGERALLLKLPEHEVPFGFTGPFARSFAELAPETARHQWTLSIDGLDGRTLQCVRKCGHERFDAVRDGVDLEQEEVSRRLPGAVAALKSNRWLSNAQVAARAQTAAAPEAAASPRKEEGPPTSLASTCAGSSHHAPTSCSTFQAAPSMTFLSTYGDVPPPVAGVAQSSVVSVADEIRKLAELTCQGVLTDEEFQVQKTRLLSEPLAVR